MGHKIRDFMLGVGSVLDLTGASFVGREPDYLSFLSEEDALRTDWENVGRDLASALAKESRGKDFETTANATEG